jgi:hypothetical protein
MQTIKILVFILLMPLLAVAQKISVTGKVTAADNKAPIAGASVYLSNSSVGTSTASDGSFTLGLNPGQYTLVVSAIGYESSSQTVLADNSTIRLDIILSPRSIQLSEVKIKPMSKSDRKEALARFKAEFIGTGPNAADCKIVNPDVLSFSFSQNKTILEASTADFLVVDNNALGYRIKFLLNNYQSNFFTGDITYKGSRIFEEMKGGDSKMKRWYKRRDDAYYGSPMHFYRSLAKDSLQFNGFKIYRLSRQVNPLRPSDQEIEEGLARAEMSRAKKDSLRYWADLKNMSRYASQKFKGKFLVKDILQKSDRPGLYRLSFTDQLYVVYTKKWETNYYRDVYREPTDLNYATTIVSTTGANNYILFDNNGSVLGEPPFYQGMWSQQRISTQLPVDYVPYGKPPKNLP